MKRLTVVLIAIAIASSAIGHVRGDMPSTQSGQWTPSGALSGMRAGAASVLLPSGAVLVIGGSASDGATASVDLFGDSGTFSPMTAMTTARTEHAAVLLMDGRALVIGGRNADGAVASVEAYVDGAWTTVGSLADARWGLTATLLSDGRVLVAGGENATGPVATIETFDPATGQWTVAGTMTTARTGHGAARLADGRVLLAGGFSGDAVLNSIDVFDPASGTITAGPSLNVARAGLSATTLLDGRVLFVGGNDGSNDLASAELFNPATGAVSAAASASVARRDHQAILLPANNTVLIVGGISTTETASAEIFVPWVNQFWSTGSMTEPRSNATGLALARPGVVLMAGGEGRATSELYGFATLATDKDDYAPGESVTMFGSGWQPGETVTLALREVPQEHASRFFTAVVDESGRFVNTDFLVEPHHLGVRFYLTASGAASQAQITFTDAFRVQTVTLGPQSPNPVTVGIDATYTVTVNFNGNNPTPCTAQLTFSGLPANAVGNFGSTSVTSSSPTTTFTIQTAGVTPNPSPNPLYNFTVTATMVPVANACSASSDDDAGTLRINPAITTTTTTAVSSSQDPSVYGDAVSFTATVSPTSGTTAPTGSVQFQVDGVNVGSAVALSPSGSNGVASSSAVSTLTAVNHTISAVYTPTGSFSGSTGTFTQHVNKRPASVTPAAASKQYGAVDPTFTGTLSEFVAADNVTATYSRTTGESVTGSPYTISATLSPAGVLGNYIITSNTANFTITARALTVTADAKTKIYGNADPALTYQITSGSLAFSDAFSGALTRAAGEDVGSHAILQGTLALSANYDLHFTGANLTITTRPISVTADAKSKTYGDPDPALTYQITSGSLAFSDAFSGALTRAAGEDVGTLAILQGTLALSANYDLHFTGASLTITTRPISVTADAKTKVYGDADPALTYQITSGSLAFSDAFSGALTRAAGEDVGSHAILQGTLALSANYDLHFTGANLTITTRPISVTADAKSKTYGDADPALTYQITSGSLAFTDTFSGALTRAAGEDVGTHAILQGALALSANYDLHFTGASLTITTRPISVTADAKSKTYGDADPALTYQITSGSLAFTDTFSGALTRAAGEDVGSYAIQQGTLALDANYDMHFTGANLTITTRPISVTADAKSKVYGDADPALTYQIMSGSLAFTDTFSGALTRPAGEDVGTYAIQQGTLALNANYDLHFTGANLTINPRSITVTADAKSKTYGDADPALTYQITSGSLAFSDAFSGALTREAGEDVGSHAILQGALALSANYDLHFVGANLTIDRRDVTVTADAKSKTYGDGDPALTYQITTGSLAFSDAFSGTLTRTAGENVATYPIQQGSLALNANYDLHFNGADFTINHRPVTVTADAKSKVYGNADPALTYQITAGTLAFSDAFSGALTRATGEDVGSYAIEQGTLALSANYDLHYNGANLTISKRTVVGYITVDNKEYDGNKTATILTRTLDNVVPEDDLQLTGGSAMFADKNAGLGKLVTGTGFSLTGADAGNYLLDPAPISTTASISRRTLHVTASGYNKVYDGNQSATVTLSDDRVGGDVFTASYASALFADKNVGMNKPVSVTGITITGTDAGNYNANPSAATSANITARGLVVSAAGQDKVYDGNPNATVTLLDNRVTGDSLTTAYAGASFNDKNVGNAKPVNVTGITVTGPDAGNYAANTSAVTAANIIARPLTVTADAKSKIFGNPDPPLTYQLTSGSLVTGDVFTGALTRDSGELVGTYAIQQGTLTAGGNYAITFVPAMLTIGSWNLTGFYNPVTMSTTLTPVYNTIKGGQTVPLKFNIYAGTVERTSVSDVAGFALQVTNCAGYEDPVDDLTTTGGTQLRYDVTGHQFIQNWQTPKGANVCYKVTMTARDGSMISAYFKTK